MDESLESNLIETKQFSAVNNLSNQKGIAQEYASHAFYHPTPIKLEAFNISTMPMPTTFPTTVPTLNVQIQNSNNKSVNDISKVLNMQLTNQHLMTSNNQPFPNMTGDGKFSLPIPNNFGESLDNTPSQEHNKNIDKKNLKGKCLQLV